jgi:SsrA-binding protein
MAEDKKRFSSNINIRNRQATFQFELLDKMIAGIALKGTEIKSIREGKANLQDGYCYFANGEAFVKGVNITELKMLEARVEEKGLSLIPIRLFINDRGIAKLEIALARGKKLHDKRDSIKEKDLKRELSRIKLG